MLVTSCADVDKDSIKTSFELSQDVLNVPAKGGSFTVTCSVTNPIDGQSVAFEYDSDWISDIKVTNDKYIKIEVNANTGDETRETEITLSYSTFHENLRVIQSAFSEEEPAFAVTIKEIKDVSVVFDVDPLDDDIPYIVISVPAESINEDMSDNKVFSMIIDFYTEYASSYGMSLSDFISAAQILVSGDITNARVSDLIPETSYVLLVVGMDDFGNRLSNVVRVPFSTNAVEMIDVEFQLEVNVSGPDASMTVTPSSDEYGYFAYHVTKQRLMDDTDGDIVSFAQSYVSMVFSFLTGVGGMTPEEALQNMLSWGEFTYEFELAANTEYIGYAVCVNENGYVCSDVATTEFLTGDVLPSDNQIRVTISDINVDRVDYKVETTNDDQYYFKIDDVKWYEGKTDAQIVDSISKRVWSWDLNRGDISGTWDLLGPGTDYYVLAFGYYGAQSTTDLLKMKFTTLSEPADPSDFRIETTVSDITATSAKVQVRGIPHSVLYYWGICSTDMSASAIREQVNAEIEDLIDNDDFYDSKRLFFMYNCARNHDELDFSDLKNGDYKVYAIAVDENTWEFAGDAVFGDEFKISSSRNTGMDPHVNILKPLVKDKNSIKSSKIIILSPVKEEPAISKHNWNTVPQKQDKPFRYSGLNMLVR